MNIEFLKAGLNVWLVFYTGIYFSKLIYLIVQLAEKEIKTRLQFLYWVLPFGGLLYIIISFIRLGKKEGEYFK